MGSSQESLPGSLDHMRSPPPSFYDNSTTASVMSNMSLQDHFTDDGIDCYTNGSADLSVSVDVPPVVACNRERYNTMPDMRLALDSVNDSMSPEIEILEIVAKMPTPPRKPKRLSVFENLHKESDSSSRYRTHTGHMRVHASSDDDDDDDDTSTFDTSGARSGDSDAGTTTSHDDDAPEQSAINHTPRSVEHGFLPSAMPH